MNISFLRNFRSHSLKRVLKTKFAILLLLTTCALGSIHRVPSDYPTIQAGIDASADGDTVLVAPGTYTGDGNRDIDFKGKAITVKSEDGPQACIIDCQGSEDEPHRGFQFVSGEGRDSVLAGFKIINGFGSEIIINEWHNQAVAGAILCRDSSPTIFGCVIEGNFTGDYGYGGGIYCLNSSAAIIKCIVQNNKANAGGGIFCNLGSVVIDQCVLSSNITSGRTGDVIYTYRFCGGGICCLNSSAVITKCIVQDNKTIGRIGGGGGIYCIGGNVVIDQCILSSNISDCGGGIVFYRGAGSVLNCLISRNESRGGGSGILCNNRNADVTLSNCTVVRNLAYDGVGGIGCVTPRSSDSVVNPIILTNCILWGNRNGYECDLTTQINTDPAALILSHCCIQGWTPELAGEGSFGDDPLLTPDFHLQTDSACIDAGDPNTSLASLATDIDGELRSAGGQVDIGCDEFIDLDNDSLPDFWEIIHFETTVNVEADQDPDEDRYTNIQEYNQGSNPHCPPETFYVNSLSGDDYWDGLSPVWDGQHGPKATIQAAIDQASFYDKDSIIVAPGIYTGVGNRDIDFKGKVITVKSENGQDTCIIDCQGSEEDPHRGFYFHSGEGTSSVVQGFTIINGFVGDGGAIFCGGSSPTICDCTIRSNTTVNSMDYDGNGSGIYCNYSRALIKDCKIIENSAIPRWGIIAIGGQGGGIYCTNSNLTITGCEISNNTSSPHRGGAICCWMSDVTIDNCTFNNNQSTGIYISTGNLNITDCLIAKNRIDGIDSYSSNLKIADCVIADNQAEGVNCSSNNEVIIKNCDISKNRSEGLNCNWDNNILIEQCLVTANRYRGIGCYAVDRLTVNNCTIAHNRIAGISCDDGSTNCNIRNSIIWENKIELDKRLFDNPICTISYSNVQGALESVTITGDYPLKWGEGNINLDPNFINPGYWDIRGAPDSPFSPGDDIWIDGDYHLKSQAGRWDPNSQSWVQDEVTSPCIDAGDPNSPIGHEPFPNGGRINIGAYGGTAEASKSYFGEPLCETIIAADINGDCKIDFADFTIMIAHWLEDNTP
jgi:hypothetical protein